MEVVIVHGGDVNSLRGGGGTSAIRRPGRGGDRKWAPSFSPGIEQQSLREENSRSLPEGGPFRKGKIVNWEVIGKKIGDLCGSTRTKGECQNRYDTLLKAHEVVKISSRISYGGSYKRFFEITEEKRPVKFPTRLTLEWYEYIEQIEQQKQQKPCHLTSSDSGGLPSLGETQTPSGSDLAEGAGSSVTDLISSPENSPSPDPATQFLDPAVPIRSESTDLLFELIAQGPATPGVAQVVHSKLHDGDSDREDSGAVWLDQQGNNAKRVDIIALFPPVLESIDKFLQEEQDCYNFSAQYFCKDIPLRIEHCGESSSNLWDW